MCSTRLIGVFALGTLASFLGAQAVIVNTEAAVLGFVDISTTGGTQILPPPTDDSEHNIVTTVGNPLFPAGNVRIGNNGVAVAGITGGDIAYSNVAIPTTYPYFFPQGLPGVPAILAYWDDLYTTTSANPPASIWWKEDPGVLTIMWKDEYHYPDVTPGQTITFEIQVFSAPQFEKPWIQLLYADPAFGGTQNANDYGGSATIGYMGSLSPAYGANAAWGFDTHSVYFNTVLSISPRMSLAASSPSGPGSIRVDITSGPALGPYFLAATTFAGIYPNGWLYGVDMPFPELISELGSGLPFNGGLDASGDGVIGPVTGLPSGIAVYAVAFGFLPGGGVTLRTHAISQVIP
jgi:hypothetical protein